MPRPKAPSPQLGLELTQTVAVVQRLCGVDEAGRGPWPAPSMRRP